jgi:CRISPR-associated protein Csm4
MKLYKTTIEPLSYFAANLRGDTLFGQLCWMARFCYGNDCLKQLLADYDESPFMIISDAFESGYMPKPKLPLSKLLSPECAKNADKKEERKKQWIKPDDLLTFGEFHALSKKEQDSVVNVAHNSIDYRTFTTGKDGFAPYGSREIEMNKKDIYVLIDEKRFSLGELKNTFDVLGCYGYGKDSSIGKGRFTLSSFERVENLNTQSNSVMALSPFSPQGLECKAIYYDPFTRFGKKGAFRSQENPFKKPLLLADTASVVVFNHAYTKGYIGKAIRGHTTHEDIVHQGYAITTAIKEIK